jgi:UDP-N-acetylglucosamine acyltransferase
VVVQSPTTADVDPTAVLRGDVDLATDVTIGPHCVIDGTTGPVRIGAGTRLIGNVYLHGPLLLGKANIVYPNACLGFSPQARGCDPHEAGCGLSIGSNNVIRESVTIHRAMTDEGPTRVGNDNYFMAYSHTGHDCQIGDRNTFANGVQLGGHVVVQDDVTAGGLVTVHQFVRLGRGCMLSGSMATSYDVAPFLMHTGINVIGSINFVVMRRQNFTSEQIDDVKWVFKTLYRRGLPVLQAMELLRERADRPLVAEYLSFFEASKRGPASGRPQAMRSRTL